MYTGKLIEDLIASVQRAEQYAAPEQAVREEPYSPRACQWDQNSIIEDLLGVA